MSFRAVVVFACVLTATGVAVASPSPDDGEEACKHIIAVCKAAGYVESAKDKNLERDCVGPILAGRSVSGVTVSATDVAACKEFRAPKSNNGP
jgi:hypothetical protein